MNELRTLLINAIQQEINDENVAICFSGGTDSLTCLFCCLELNIKPKLYTFHLEDYVSEDVKISKKVAEYFRLDIQIVPIKKNKNRLVSDIKDLIDKIKNECQKRRGINLETEVRIVDE